MKARVSVRSSAPTARPVVASSRAVATKATTYKPAAALRSFAKFTSQTAPKTAPRFTAQKTVTKSFASSSVRTPKLFSAPRFISLDASEHFNVKTDNVFFQNDQPSGLERRETERDMMGNRELGFGGGESSTPAPGDSSAVNSPRVYVGNVPYKATNEQIKEFFTSKGLTVESIRMAQDPTGRARGWGIVQLADEEEAKKAIESLDHTTLLDRQILVRADRNRGGPRTDGEGGERRPRRNYSFEGGSGQREGGFGGREGRDGGYGGSRGGYRGDRQRSFGGDRGQRDFNSERDQGGLGGDREGFGRGGYNTNTENKSNDHQQNEMNLPKMS